jgi:hypothetical protein
MGKRENEIYAIITSLLIAVSIIALSLIFIGEPGAYTSQNVVISNVIVSKTCFITLNVPSVFFGSLAPAYGTVYTANFVGDTDTNGNANANILVYGSNLISQSNTIGITNMTWAVTNTLLGSGTAMTVVLTDTHQTVSAGGSNQIFIGFNVPSGQLPGTYVGNVVLENSC